MLAVSIISTKGGVGKTTAAANLGALLADAGLRTLLIDVEIQPGLSSYYKIVKMAECGIYELIANNEQNLERLISHTSIANLHIIYSNDPQGQLNTLLLHAPDGRLRLRNLMPIFEDHYDVVIFDSPGARGILVEMSILASDLIISTVTPDMLTAREFKRGTLQLIDDMLPYEYLGIKMPTINMLFNRVPPVSEDAKAIQKTLRELFQGHGRISLIETIIPQLEVYKKSATELTPAHRIERRRPSSRKTPAALETMTALACEIFPQWQERCSSVSGVVR